eukprot:3718789-Rhodomonas_salina.1
MSGTDIPDGDISLRARKAMSGTDGAHGAISLRAHKAMSSTDVTYGATRTGLPPRADHGPLRVSPYCRLLRYAATVRRYVCATACMPLRVCCYCMLLLRVCCYVYDATVSQSTDVCYAATSPSIVYPELDCIVVSKETESGMLLCHDWC